MIDKNTGAVMAGSLVGAAFILLLVSSRKAQPGPTNSGAKFGASAKVMASRQQSGRNPSGFPITF